VIKKKDKKENKVLNGHIKFNDVQILRVNKIFSFICSKKKFSFILRNS